MSTIFRLDASIRQDGSVTRAVADTLEETIAEELGSPAVVRRDLGSNPIDPTLWPLAAFAGYTPEEQRTPEQVAAIQDAAALADEVVSADVLVFAVPLYNFGVSQHFKAWYDLVATDPRLSVGQSTVTGKPAFLVTARGGGYGAGTPREGWDHATGWMRRVLEDVWGLDLDVIETELTLAEVTPQMAELRDLAREQLAESHETARRSGRSVTIKLRPAA
ncbi:FMN-dependent NADH-azoreductase [Aeromicrobium ginsengisoli]|uniref:FMN dependent NADH:quinone oxidoreductase n=1 Tax=Aeromicrobium ginsengisoli TaxID=363867 RepID=A0A5M4FBI4_9ACTN|nr:NAD(P)H-dependent oxidoreductase [Aeromicrobium ginsengisoli]KAA1395734.1 flavodoxin family protein [Aeromicrobium ginsengisoli]